MTGIFSYSNAIIHSQLKVFCLNAAYVTFAQLKMSNKDNGIYVKMSENNNKKKNEINKEKKINKEIIET